MTHVISLVQLKRELEQQLSDLSWEGLPYNHIQDKLRSVNERIKEGKLWEPLF